MGEDQGSDVQTTPKPSPTKAVGKAIATSFCWDSDAEKKGEAPEPILNECKLLVHYKASGAYIGKRDILVNPGKIREAMKADYDEKRQPVYDAAYEEAYQPAYDGAIDEDKTPEKATEIAEAAARQAGNEAVAEAGISMGDSEASFTAAANKIKAGESAADLVALLASKDWGKLILNDAWDNGR
jgi:hypothetical protein